MFEKLDEREKYLRKKLGDDEEEYEDNEDEYEDNEDENEEEEES
jgi:hypothetical protein